MRPIVGWVGSLCIRSVWAINSSTRQPIVPLWPRTEWAPGEYICADLALPNSNWVAFFPLSTGDLMLSQDACGLFLEAVDDEGEENFEVLRTGIYPSNRSGCTKEKLALWRDSRRNQNRGYCDALGWDPKLAKSILNLTGRKWSQPPSRPASGWSEKVCNHSPQVFVFLFFFINFMCGNWFPFKQEMKKPRYFFWPTSTCDLLRPFVVDSTFDLAEGTCLMLRFASLGFHPEASQYSRSWTPEGPSQLWCFFCIPGSIR